MTMGAVFLLSSPRKLAPGIFCMLDIDAEGGEASLTRTAMGSAMVADPASNSRVVVKPELPASFMSAFAFSMSVA